MITLLNEKDWKNLRREPYQKFSDYQKRLDFNLKNIQIGLNNLENDSALERMAITKSFLELNRYLNYQ